MLLRPVLMPILRNPLQGIADGIRNMLAELLGSSQFFAPLTHSLVLARGTGSPTFTRPSTATVEGYGPTDNAVDGLKLLTVAANEARFVGARRISEGVWSNTFADGSLIPAATNTGYLAEGARTNLCLYSNDLSNAVWTPLGSTISANAGPAPDGTTTADKIVETATTANHEVLQGVAGAAGSYTVSAHLSAAGRNYGFVLIATDGATKTFCAVVDLVTGVVTDTESTGTPVSASATVSPAGDGIWRISCTATHAAGDVYIIVGASDSGTPTHAVGRPSYAGDITKGVYCSFVGIEAGSSASSYIATTTAAVTRASDADATPTASNILAAASTVYLEFTPDHTPSGTIALWGTYVDASNYTAILHDATNLIFRKRIAGVNYDATIANAFTANTTYKVCGSWGASGVTVTLDGTEGTANANTTAAQIAATMQWGADGNSLQQPFATVRNARVWQRQLSTSERGAVTA